MELVIRPRQSGKTTAVLRHLISEPTSCLIVADEVQKQWCADQVHRMHLDGAVNAPIITKHIRDRIFTPLSLADGSFARHRVAHPRGLVHMDNLEHFLEPLLGWPLGIVTMTGRDKTRDELSYSITERVMRMLGRQLDKAPNELLRAIDQGVNLDLELRFDVVDILSDGTAQTSHRENLSLGGKE